MTKTTSFIRPILKDFSYAELVNQGFIDSYLGYYAKTKDSWGKFLYLSFDLSKINQEFRLKLLSHKSFNAIHMDKEVLLFEFIVSESDYTKIVKPFLDGKYSKVCREYVNSCFQRFSYSSASNSQVESNNWKILHKHRSLADYWEKKIGVTFTEDMEVWRKKKKEEEIYGYPKSDTELAPEAGSISSSGC